VGLLQTLLHPSGQQISPLLHPLLSMQLKRGLNTQAPTENCGETGGHEPLSEGGGAPTEASLHTLLHPSEQHSFPVVHSESLRQLILGSKEHIPPNDAFEGGH